jgi:hypothetical protein
MTPSYAIKKGVRYRYFISCVLARGRKEEAGAVSRIAASDIEKIVVDAVAALVPSNEQSAAADRLGLRRRSSNVSANLSLLVGGDSVATKPAPETGGYAHGRQ